MVHELRLIDSDQLSRTSVHALGTDHGSCFGVVGVVHDPGARSLIT